jgi:hypothetical protein
MNTGHVKMPMNAAMRVNTPLNVLIRASLMLGIGSKSVRKLNPRLLQSNPKLLKSASAVSCPEVSQNCQEVF